MLANSAQVQYVPHRGGGADLCLQVQRQSGSHTPPPGLVWSIPCPGTVCPVTGSCVV